MFNCDVSQTLSAINSAADSIKIISTDLWVFLTGVAESWQNFPANTEEKFGAEKKSGPLKNFTF
jgi:hypothetical protein